jgi:hypothetical protein
MNEDKVFNSGYDMKIIDSKLLALYGHKLFLLVFTILHWNC